MTRVRHALPALLFVLAILAACSPGDPRERILTDRARWNVTLLSWAMDEGGRISASARVSGPVRSDLQRLTVRVDMLDARDAVVGSSWETLDLSDIQRGGPKDVFLRVDAAGANVEGLRLDTMPDPTPEQATRIPELALSGD